MTNLSFKAIYHIKLDCPVTHKRGREQKSRSIDNSTTAACQLPLVEG
jgi:hypothetical protein